jgi:DedD protein
VAVDIPIDLHRKDGAPPLVMPAPRTAAAPASVAVPVDDAVAVPKPAASSAAPAKPVAVEKPVPVEKPADKPGDKPTARAAAAASAVPPAKADGARAQALLEAGAASKPTEGGGRFVVQVGAFTDPAAVREARAKVEKLGLKSYTQAVESSTGPRTRVRVGPFASREDAERALGKAKAAGLDGVVLSL